MLTASLVINVAVLLPVCGGLLRNSSRMTDVFGPSTPARGILLAIYLAISIVSALLLAIGETQWAVALLLVQCIYKFLSPLTARVLVNPVILSNLAIATFHTITLVVTGC